MLNLICFSYLTSFVVNKLPFNKIIKKNNETHTYYVGKGKINRYIIKENDRHKVIFYVKCKEKK